MLEQRDRDTQCLMFTMRGGVLLDHRLVEAISVPRPGDRAVGDVGRIGGVIVGQLHLESNLLLKLEGDQVGPRVYLQRVYGAGWYVSRYP